MGLDMYLMKKMYVGNKHKKTVEQVKVTAPKKNGILVKNNRISEIVEEVGYWRKANAIHRWFVDNVGGGDDNSGGEMRVSLEELTELLKLCKRVFNESEMVDGKVHNGTQFSKEKGTEEIYEDGKIIKDPTVAKELLPTQNGFFFGSTDYDQYYMQDIIQTIDILTTVIKENDTDADYYYEASW